MLEAFTNKLTENCRCSSLPMPIHTHIHTHMCIYIYRHVLLFSNWVIGSLPLQLFWQFDYRHWTHGKIYIRLFIVSRVDWIPRECLAINNGNYHPNVFFPLSIYLFLVEINYFLSVVLTRLYFKNQFLFVICVLERL